LTSNRASSAPCTLPSQAATIFSIAISVHLEAILTQSPANSRDRGYPSGIGAKFWDRREDLMACATSPQSLPPKVAANTFADRIPMAQAGLGSGGPWRKLAGGCGRQRSPGRAQERHHLRYRRERRCGIEITFDLVLRSGCRWKRVRRACAYSIRFSEWPT
jgi:hypothetical protein